MNAGRKNMTGATGTRASASCPANKKTEPERIRALYEVKACRVEPIGLVYLLAAGDVDVLEIVAGGTPDHRLAHERHSLSASGNESIA